MISNIFCFFCAWALVSLFIWKTWQAGKQGFSYLKILHQIPCNRCAFFTGDYRLKCTVNPLIAMSEEAISCRDFQPINFPTVKVCSYCQSPCSSKIKIG